MQCINTTKSQALKHTRIKKPVLSPCKSSSWSHTIFIITQITKFANCTCQSFIVLFNILSLGDKIHKKIKCFWALQNGYKRNKETTQPSSWEFVSLWNSKFQQCPQLQKPGQPRTSRLRLAAHRLSMSWQKKKALTLHPEALNYHPQGAIRCKWGDANVCRFWEQVPLTTHPCSTQVSPSISGCSGLCSVSIFCEPASDH